MATLSELYEELDSEHGSISKASELESLLALHSRLLSPERLRPSANDRSQVEKLSTWIAKAILPEGSIIPSEEAPETDDPSGRKSSLNLIRRKGTLGLKALYTLFENFTPDFGFLDDLIVLSIIAHTCPEDSWTTESSVADAKTLLSMPAIEAYAHTPEFIVTFLLQSFIRPLFSSSKPSTITKSSRKATPSSLPPKHTPFPTRASQPWKYKSPHSLPALSWVVSNISSAELSKSWHLLVPPVLTLLDSVTAPHRLRGLQILTSLLPQMQLKVLIQTGLGSVFEDAVTPTLMFVPTITELEESVLLLPAAYSALFALFNTFWSSKSSPKSETQEPEREKYQFLDRVLRKGILPAYQHCATVPEIVEILLIQLRRVVEYMGMYSVKHLSQILPLLGAVLSDPFASARPSLLLAGTKCLQTVVFNSWPRMIVESHRREVIKMLCLCWKNIREAEEEDAEVKLGEVRKEMKQAGRWFVAAAKVAEEYGIIRRELGELVDADRTLIELFGL